MPADKQDRSVGSAKGVKASKPSLLVIFYVPIGKARALHEHLESLLQGSSALPGDGLDRSDDVSAEKDATPITHDAVAVRLTLRAEGDVTTAWDAMERLLRRILGTLDEGDSCWCYTVFYRAILDDGEEADSALTRLLPTVRKLNSTNDLQPQAQADLSGSAVWLLTPPKRTKYATGPIIYVALNPAAGKQDFDGALITSGLLAGDLIAHKGRSLERQFRGSAQQDYETKLQALWGTTDKLLEDHGRRLRGPDELDDVARVYNELLGVVSTFNRLSNSMAEELDAYKSWQQHAADNAITEYQRSRLETANRELETKIKRGQGALDVAKTAIDMAQVLQVDERQEDRQRILQYLLAVIGAGLAVPGLINQETAGALLAWLTFQPDYDNKFVIFLAQIAAIGIFATFLVLIFLFFSGLRRFAALIGSLIVMLAVMGIFLYNQNRQAMAIENLLVSHYEEVGTEKYRAAFADFSKAEKDRRGSAEEYADDNETWCKDVGSDIQEPRVDDVERNEAVSTVNVVYHTTCGGLPDQFDTEIRYVWGLAKEGGEWKLDSREEERVEYSQIPMEVPNGGPKLSSFNGPERGSLDSIRASNTALSAQDACGETFDLPPANVVDGQQNTAWQVGGTGVDQWIELTYEEPIKVDRVGIIPGYAKVDPCDGTDRFYQYYAVRAARIEFSDGSAVGAEFEQDPRMQVVDVPDTETTSLRVTILDVHPPGNKPGELAFDYEDTGTLGKTAISEIQVE